MHAKIIPHTNIFDAGEKTAFACNSRKPYLCLALRNRLLNALRDQQVYEYHAAALRQAIMGSDSSVAEGLQKKKPNSSYYSLSIPCRKNEKCILPALY